MSDVYVKPGASDFRMFRKIVKDAYEYLKIESFLCFEIGYDQKIDVIEIIENDMFKLVMNDGNTILADSKNVYLEYNDSKLKDLRVSEEITEVMVVSSKKVVLLDPANLQDYQFVHACEFLTSSNHRLTYFISSSTYDSIEIGEQLQVTYKVYTNANKLDMPVIVHNRDSHKDMMDILREYKPKNAIIPNFTAFYRAEPT